MLKISVVDAAHRRRIVVEGAIVAPWADELSTAFERARADLQGRELIVDLRGVTAISRDGENVLIQLLRHKIKVQCGIFAKELLRQLASDAQLNPTKVRDATDDVDSKG
jgi:anti-anti-sigma regulatory factor